MSEPRVRVAEHTGPNGPRQWGPDAPIAFDVTELADVDAGTIVPDDAPTASLPQGLTREEDDVLRRLYYLSQHGALSDEMREKIIELRLRDRRKEIRPPREFEKPYNKGGGTKRGWAQKLLGRGGGAV